MRALVLADHDRPPTLASFAEPVAGEGTEVVTVTGAGLNPFDVVHASGRHPIGVPPLPSVVGREGVGRTADGLRVYFDGASADFGAVAERSLVARERLFEVRDDVDDRTAIALGAAGISAWLPLAERARLAAGEGVLVLGATGAVGQVAVQAAKLLGAGRVVAAGRRPQALERCLGLGADAVVDLTADDLHAALSAAADGPIDVVVDLLWGAPARAALEVCAPHARVVQVGSSAATATEMSANPWRTRWVSILGYSTLTAPPALKRAAYATVLEHAAAGRLTVDADLVPFADAERAWQRVVDGAGRKIVLDVTATPPR